MTPLVEHDCSQLSSSSLGKDHTSLPMAMGCLQRIVLPCSTDNGFGCVSCSGLQNIAEVTCETSEEVLRTVGSLWVPMLFSLHHENSGSRRHHASQHETIQGAEWPLEQSVTHLCEQEIHLGYCKPPKFWSDFITSVLPRESWLIQHPPLGIHDKHSKNDKGWFG